MKKLITLSGLILFLAAGCNTAVQTSDNNTSTQSTTQTQTQQNPTTPPSTAGSTFIDSTKKISLDYSGLSMQTQTPGSYIPPQNNFPGNGQDLLQLYLDPKIYIGTNLESAWFNLAIRDGSSFSQAQCYAKPSQESASAFNKKRVVQNNTWYYASPNPRSDAAAGHTASVETYRLYKNNLCYEVALGLSAYNRGNLENPNSIKEYDQQKIFGYLGAVFNKLNIH